MISVTYAQAFWRGAREMAAILFFGTIAVEVVFGVITYIQECCP